MPSRKNNLLIAGVLLLGSVLAGCSPASVAEQVTPPEPTAVAVVETQLPTAVPPNTAPPATPTDMPTPTEEPVVDNCVDCHTDKDRLIDMADPVLEVISENEGEG